MDFDYARAVEVAQEFKKLLSGAKQVMAMCEAEIQEADKAFGDIRHYCELHYSSDRKQHRKVCKLINEYSKRRRLAKDIEAVVRPLADFAEFEPRAKGQLEYIVNSMAKELKRVEGERVYVPRVLDDLFKDGEKNDTQGG